MKPALSRLWVVPTVVLGLLFTLCVAPPAQAADRTSSTEARRVDRVKTPKLTWVEAADGSGYSAKVKLPRDYDKPTGSTVTIALFKIPAADPASRIGTLFLNPGGPGGSGVDIAMAATGFLTQSVLDRFDIVGFDPRGTNSSSRVRCFSSSGTQAYALSSMDVAFPSTSVEESRFILAGKRLAKGCSGYGATLASSVSTAEVARDLDVLRRAVGDKKLNYLGFSYGTYLGEVYANLFPDRFRALVLDGVLNPIAYAGTKATRGTPTTLRIKSGEAAWNALEAGLAACEAAGPETCPLSDPQMDFDQVAATLKQAPVNVLSGDATFSYSYNDFIADVLNLLYYPDGMDFVAQLVATLQEVIAEDNPGTSTASSQQLASLVRALGRSTSGLETVSSYNNDLEAYSAVICSDTYQPADPKTWSAATRTADLRAPHFGRLWGWSDVQCATNYWKAKDEDVYRGTYSKRTASPVLIVGNYHDPATNYAGATETKALMPNSYLVRSDSWGHTAYGTSGCVTDRVDAYLLKLTQPDTSVCVGDVQPFTAQVSASSKARSNGALRVAVPSRDGLPPVVQPWENR